MILTGDGHQAMVDRPLAQLGLKRVTPQYDDPRKKMARRPNPDVISIIGWRARGGIRIRSIDTLIAGANQRR
jgi:hypothetical protein